MLNYKKNFISKLPYKVDRVTLRHVSEMDTIRLSFIREKEDKEAEYTPLPLEEKPKDHFDFNEKTEKYSEIIFSDDRMQIGIYLGFDLIGELHVFGYNNRNKSLEFGYYMIPEFRNNGYAFEALNAFISLLFENEDIRKLYARTGEFNTSSVKLLEKSGFQLEGRFIQGHELNGEYFDELSYYKIKE